MRASWGVVGVVLLSVAMSHAQERAQPRQGPGAIHTADMTRAKRIMGSKDMVMVPSGAFLRGSPKGVGNPSEQPQRQIFLSSFWIDRLEVTASQYRDCVSAGRCSSPIITEDQCTFSAPGKDAHPINCVSWEQAKAYCTWVGKRLPTDAEWEKAARGTDGRLFPWGNEPATCKRACMSEGGWGCGSGGTCPVGAYPTGVSPYGALDMAGGVWEWTADWFGQDYYTRASARNPTGPKTGMRHSVRGGGFGMSGDGLTCPNRDGGFSGNYMGGNATGFRCAK